jgi:hypothetical protein
MQQEPPSIFDDDFIAETLIRRRELMSVGLKMYVWFPGKSYWPAVSVREGQRAKRLWSPLIPSSY